MTTNKITKIILHWTAGGYSPNATDLEHYHYLIDKDGKVHNGKYKPEDNLNCYDGKYAAHCGGGNTGTIGIALCGMAGYRNSSKPGYCFITRKQCEAMFKLSAELLRRYSLPLDTTSLKTHAEFGRENPKTTSNGKIDITALPPCYDLEVTKAVINASDKAHGYGNVIRSRVKWYYQKLQ